jgi:PAS domain S-box-containing protein
MKNEVHQIDTDVELRFSDILDALPFYVLLIDEHHRILLANGAVRDQLGVEPEAIIGKYCPQIIHGQDEPWYACPLEEAVEKGQGVEREAFDQKSGRWIRSVVYPIRRATRDGSKIFFHMVSDITDRKQAEERLSASLEQLREVSLHLESVREKERTNIAREIHDELGQILTGLKIDLSWLAKRLPKEPELFVEKIKSMYEMIDIAVQTVKRISTELRPGALDDLGISAAIEWQAQEFEKRTGIKVHFKATPKDIVLERDLSTSIFRIFQEALTNVIRHADATSVEVSLKKEKDRILLRIIDNGKGIEEKQIADPKAFGLIGMRERARFWGGEVEISGNPGKGTVVAVNIPLVGREKINAENINS